MEPILNPALTENLLLKLSMELSVSVTRYGRRLRTAEWWDIRSQLIRSATSIGANAWEAQGAESDRDFLHKLKISQKETHETEYWLLLIHQINGHAEIVDLLRQLQSVRRVLFRIISTMEKRMDTTPKKTFRTPHT